MNKIYLVILDNYHEEENSIVNICSTLEKAIELKEEYTARTKDVGYDYHIDELDFKEIDSDILWDCYYNSIFDRYESPDNP